MMDFYKAVNLERILDADDTITVNKAVTQVSYHKLAFELITVVIIPGYI